MTFDGEIDCLSAGSDGHRLLKPCGISAYQFCVMQGKCGKLPLLMVTEQPRDLCASLSAVGVGI